jgi:hypothetical protein
MVPGGRDVYIIEKQSPELSGQFQSNLVQIIHEYREFKIVQIKGHVFFKGEIIAKIRLGVYKLFFSRTTEPENLIFK